MNAILIIVLLVLMGLVVYSLVRGIIAFLRTTRQDIDAGGDGNMYELQLMQNKMMFARVKYQALAILVVGILLMINR